MFTLSCESTTDLPYVYLKKRRIPVLQYTYTIGEIEFLDDMGQNPDELSNFYKLLKDKRATTSQICQERYVEFFREQLKRGDLIHIAFSSALSQSVFNAFTAMEIVKKEFPHRRIYVVDSLCGCVGYGLLIDILADMRDNCKDIDAIYSYAEQNKHKIHHHFFSTTLTYFRRSGRVTGANAFIGNLLNLCPIMHVNNAGQIVAHSKVLSSKKAIAVTLKETAELIENGFSYNGKLWVGHSNCIDLAFPVVEKLKECYPDADVRLYDIGPVIASHCGPGTVAVFFVGDTRK